MVSFKAITFFLLAIEVLPYFQIVAQFQKPKMALQVLVPQSIDTEAYLGTLMHGIHPLKYRHKRLDIGGYINVIKTNSPDEILRIFCDDIVPKSVNTIVYIRRTDTQIESASSDYILSIASQLGYPIIAWDPYYVGSLESRAEARDLQIAPTIYHQCQAMLTLLHRYNWTDFSVVTDVSTSHLDFISSIKQLVKLNNMDKSRFKRPKLTMLSSIILHFDTFYEEERKTEIITMGLKKADKDNRIFLLHAGSPETKDILEKAVHLNLTGSKYMWILSATSVSLSLSRMAHRAYPLGTIGLHYNASRGKIIDVIYTSITLWEQSLNAFNVELNKRPNASSAPSIGICSKGRKKAFWEEGSILYKKMRGLTLDVHVAMPLKFDKNGVNQLVSLEFLNVQEKFDKRYRIHRKYWSEVGRWIPQNRGRNMEMGIEMDDITWPGNAAIPPKGKPERIHLSIATLKEKPYIIYSDIDNSTGSCTHPAVPCRLQANKNSINASSDGTVMSCCLGLCIDLLNIISERVGFDFDLFEVPDKEWGLQNEHTNEWNGLIRLLIDQKADFVMTSLKITKERNAYINFSVPYLQTGITIVVSIRKGAISPTAFLEPYDYASWCLILVFSVHATGASIFIFEWLSPSGLNQGQTSLREHKFSLFRSFWLIWGMLFGASVSADNPRGVSSRFLSNVWALFALVFLASYTANLAAFMITKEEYYDLSGIEDWRLRQPYSLKPPFRYATFPNGSTEENMKKNYPDMYKYMKQFNQSTVDEGIDSLKKQRIHAFIYDATVLDYRVGSDSDCDLITVGSWFAETGYGVGFPKGSPYIEKVNKIILDLQEYGELERLQRFWLAGACHQKEKTGASRHDIGILNFTSAFILLAGGVLLGAILLALEHLYFKFGRTCLRKYDKRGCCALVSLSMGKSLTFEKSVLAAIDYHKKHRCKDQLCETQLWKVKHELDLALLRVDKLKTELAQYRKQVDEGAKHEDDQNRPNGVRRASRNSQEPSTSETDERPFDKNRQEPGVHDSINRSFRRSPSYTHAISDNSSQQGKPNKVRYHDGKYYVGVSDDDQTESSF